MAPLRVGVLGQGRSGLDIHCRWFQQVPRKFRIVAVSDLLADRRRRAQEKFGCDVYRNYDELLARDDLDLVVNSLPSHLHPSVTIAALQSGHHVVCEKPLAWNIAELDGMIAAARKARRRLIPFQQRRFDATFQKIIAVIDSGVLGRIVQARIASNGFARRWDWQTLQEFGGGNLLNTGPHFLDQALCLLGYRRPDSVICAMDRANTLGDADDYVKVVIKKKGAPVIDLEISSCDAYAGDMYNIQGTQGGLTGGGGELRWRYYNPRTAPRQRLQRSPLPGPSYCRENLKLTEKCWRPTKVQSNLFSYISKQFYDRVSTALREGATLEVTPQQVRIQMAVVEECFRQVKLSRLPRKGWPGSRSREGRSTP
ncbi:MAG: Gfo/Idh/MocA family oxidoreductase [Candidatus Latescibacterota bacterium]|nr:Gfo/Idh/MocA family oxidoreductase [Candidatus Latescibacterota bacterium]